jgi:hypothetical protein
MSSELKRGGTADELLETRVSGFSAQMALRHAGTRAGWDCNYLVEP